ncbi:MFS-type transporter SLC18B1-like isoform X2 [Convolutriloba macropyga]|uniref:MFS-type transporter SLC18B1-like isoform X2 n=1 Tax=Convolutriloba macropyga TaxID=536237 RepID=UPI003F528DEB
MCYQIGVKTTIAIAFSLFLFIAEGINYSQLAPFFPNEAELNKDLSKFLVGAISSCFDFSTLIFTLCLPLVARPELNKFFFVWGAIIGALANMGFGVLGAGPGGIWFASMCFLCRILMGIGAGMIWSTGIPLLTSLAPAYAGRITSLVESGAGFGIAIGPPIGSAVYSLGGYEYPFLTSGGIEMVLVIFVIFLLPEPVVETRNRMDDEDDFHDNRLIYDSADESKDSADVPMLGVTNDTSGPADTSTQIEITTQEQQASATTFQAFIEFLSFPGIWAVSLIFPLFGVPFGLLDVSLSPYLLDHFGVDGDTAGLYFLSLGAMYAICTQFTGYITDKGGAAYIFFWYSNLLVGNSFLYFLPSLVSALEQKWYIAMVLAINGFAMSGTYVPIYLVLQELALSSGYSKGLENLKLVIGIWINFLMAVFSWKNHWLSWLRRRALPYVWILSHILDSSMLLHCGSTVQQHLPCSLRKLQTNVL